MTVPTSVAFGLFSAAGKVAGFTVGTSFAFVRLIVIVADALSGGAPLSVTCTVRPKLGVVSKSSAAAFATVISPVVGSIANAPPVLPPVIAKVWIWPVSGSLNVTLPTTVALALFSGRLNVAGLTTGASLGSVRVIVTVASSEIDSAVLVRRYWKV